MLQGDEGPHIGAGHLEIRSEHVTLPRVFLIFPLCVLGGGEARPDKTILE